MRYRSSYSNRYRPSMHQPVLPIKVKSELAKRYESIFPPPECEYKRWEKLDSYDRRLTHAKQYERLLTNLQNATAALKEFLHEPIHKQARNPQTLRKQLKQIEVYEEQYKAWDTKRNLYIKEAWQHQVRQDDDDHVATTGRCCGPNRHGVPRRCSRRATDGNFCYQHISKAYDYRR